LPVGLSARDRLSVVSLCKQQLCWDINTVLVRSKNLQ